MKMIAKQNYVDPYTSEVHVKGAEFDHPDEKLCVYLVETQVLDYAKEEPAPVVDKTDNKVVDNKASK